MKGLFGFAGLLLALVVTGLLIRQQMSAMKPSAPSLAPAPASVSGSDRVTNDAAPSPKDIPQQYKQALEAAIQTPRAVPDEKP
jgi:predicted lipid-binding transport protein (Tim44 family)